MAVFFIHIPPHISTETSHCTPPHSKELNRFFSNEHSSYVMKVMAVCSSYMPKPVTFEGIQSFAGADGGQGLVVVEILVEVRHGGGDGVGVDVGFDLSF